MDSFVRDLRHSFRALAHHPGFLAIVVATLALGIGASTAIFSVVNSILFRALPYTDAEKLVFVWSGDPREGTNGLVVSMPDFLDWKEQSLAFSDMAAFNVVAGQLTGGPNPEEVWGAVVTPSFFSVLGVKPTLGRSFPPGSAADEKVLLLSHGLWQRRFGGDPGIVGTRVILSGQPYTVLGVLPAEFKHPEPFLQREADFWRPLRYDPQTMGRDSRFFRVVARLKPSVGIASAQAEMKEVIHRLESRLPESKRGRRVTVIALREQLFGDLRRPLAILLATAGFVLLIACANIANLQMARALSRQREIVVRTTLGAQPMQIIRHALAESVILAVSGGVFGLFLAFLGTRALVSLGPSGVPGLQQVALDSRVLLFAAALTLFTALATGAFPVIRALRPDLTGVLKATSRTTAGQSLRWARNSLAVAEIALALPLLIGAALLARSALELSRVSPGFQQERLLTFRLSLPKRRYPETSEIQGFFSDTLQKLQTLPGVRTAGLVSSLPLTGLNDQVRDVFAEETLPSSPTSAHYRVVGGDYFTAMGIPVLAGRVFDSRNEDRDQASVVVSSTFARKAWPGESAVGKRIRLGEESSGAPWLSVVGVVGDVLDSGFNSEPAPVAYVSLPKDPWSSMAVVVRSQSTPLELVKQVQATIWQRDSELPLADVQSMEQLVSRSNMSSRFNAFSISALAALACVLALVGVFGVIGYFVGERTREFGIRMVLGARRHDVLLLVLRHACALAMAGLFLGIALAFYLTRALAQLLFRIDTTDPETFLVCTILLFSTALLAAAVPARRAAAADPVVTLRSE